MKAYTSKQIETITNKYLNGDKINRSDIIFHQNIIGARKTNIDLILTSEELIEYSKCYSDVLYFIEKYCCIKLQDYQKEIIKKYHENKYNIFLNSNETETDTIILILLLHYMIFNFDKTICLISWKNTTIIEKISKLKNIYKKIPYFLKPGVWNLSSKHIYFDNGSRIISSASYYIAMGYNIDILLLNDFSKFSDNIANNLLDSIIPTLNYQPNSKIIISSRPNGKNHFYKMVYESELPFNAPSKNIYNTLRIYWWMVEGRDENWKNDIIKDYGQDVFDRDYDLLFNI